MKNNTKISLVIIAVLAIIGGVVFFGKDRGDGGAKPMEEAVIPTQPYNGPGWEITEKEEKERLSQIDENDTHVKILTELREVKICDKNYRAKTLLVDGVDILKRIAEILPSEKVSCFNFLQRNPSSGDLNFYLNYTVTGGYNQEQKENVPMQVVKDFYVLQLGETDVHGNKFQVVIDIQKKTIIFPSGIGADDTVFPLVK